MFYLKMFLSFMFVLVSGIALAQNPVMPEVDPFALIWELIKNYKELSPFAISIAVVIIAGQMAKAFLPNDFKYKRILILLLSLAYSVAFFLSQGINIASTLILVFVTNLGAKYLYVELQGIIDFSKGVLSYVKKILDKFFS